MELKSLTEQKSLLATLPPGKRARLHRLLFEFGPGNGTLMLLPIDQGIEHGPRDFFPNPASKDPDYQFRLAAEAGYSALACQIGMAEKYYPDYAGRVPLILKVNGKTDIPSSAKSFSSCNSSVEDGVRLGADAIGYTLYVGSPRQDEDLAQLRQVRQECDRFGMPLVVWSYPRGEAVDAKGSANSFYAIDYAARMAMEMGADIVKLNMPKIDAEQGQGRPRSLQRDGGRPGRGDPPVRRIGRPRPGRPLRRLQDRRRDRPHQHPRGDGGGRLAASSSAATSGSASGTRRWRSSSRSRRRCSPTCAALPSAGRDAPRLERRCAVRP